MWIDIAIATAAMLAVAGAVVFTVRRRKKGGTGCAGCGGCPYSGNCKEQGREDNCPPKNKI
ncbi:MAG: FeoB-associated Cys-rich membrane protein [Oscillospiraceae bacterium]|nr:FeoB-associated Cys-rich membrane protein [Oscillospiraceae bacterium]